MNTSSNVKKMKRQRPLKSQWSSINHLNKEKPDHRKNVESKRERSFEI